MARAKKSFHLELTKEQRALILEKTGMEAKELELTDDALIQADPKQVGKERSGPEPFPRDKGTL